MLPTGWPLPGDYCGLGRQGVTCVTQCSPVCKRLACRKHGLGRAIRNLILTRSVGILKFSPQALKRLRAGGGGLRADLRSACLGEPPKAPVHSFLWTLPHPFVAISIPPCIHVYVYISVSVGLSLFSLSLSLSLSVSLSLSLSLSPSLSLALSAAIYLHSLGRKVNPERML